MSSTEPPSRNLPRGHSPDSKTARDELSSKNKVEKVREVDADETRKRQKWLSAYPDKDQPNKNNDETESRPNLFDIASQPSEKKGASKPNMGDVKDAIVPSPSYSPPPSVSSFGSSDEESEDDETTSSALPQSDDFWEDVDFADRPMSTTTFQETPELTSDKKGAHVTSIENQKRKKAQELLAAQKKGQKEESHLAIPVKSEKETSKTVKSDKKGVGELIKRRG